MIQTHLPNQAGRKIAVAAIAPLRAPLRFDEIQLEHRFADPPPSPDSTLEVFRTSCV